MHRWKTWSALLFAVVLSLGMIGVAAAEPPDPHPACEKENPPPGCEENGRPGDPDEDDDDGGEDPGGDENPLAPLGEVCSQVVQAVAGGDPTGQAIQLHALCEALGAEPLEDDDEGGDDEEPGEEESPTQPIADGCNTVIDEMVGGGAPPEVEQGRQLCDQFGERPADDDDGDEGEEPGGGDEGSPLAEGCDQLVDALTGVSEEFEQGRALCEQAP